MSTKIVQEEIREIRCDACNREIGREPIRVDSYYHSSHEEGYTLCSVKCLISWLSLADDRYFDFNRRFQDLYSYHISMNGEDMTAFADWVREK